MTLKNERFQNIKIKESFCIVEVSLDALGLLCENHKTTEGVRSLDLQLIRLFLTYHLSSQSPSFRQQLVAYLKKVKTCLIYQAVFHVCLHGKVETAAAVR